MIIIYILCVLCWLLIGAMTYIVNETKIKKKDIYYEDLVFMIIPTIYGPFTIVGYIIIFLTDCLFDKYGNKIIFKAKD